jgi:DNA modification methylase
MKPYAQTDNYTLYLGDAWQVLDSLPENSVDAVVTDPPYEIGFMNKGWDNTGVAFNRTTWEKVLRVLKPGGHLLAFNHSRTFHRMAVAIEDAGFEIRDTIMWLYGSGFPKSHDISKAIDNKYGVQGEKIAEKKFLVKHLLDKTLVGTLITMHNSVSKMFLRQPPMKQNNGKGGVQH